MASAGTKGRTCTHIGRRIQQNGFSHQPLGAATRLRKQNILNTGPAEFTASIGASPHEAQG